MDQNNLKCIVGQACENQPAIIRFFDSVDWWSVDCFKEEFLWLQDYVHPSKIIVLINSDGGSVVQGMSVYSLIAGCPIETDCVIEGLAASMGSIIWAAGKNLYMHDYSILMIHNPYIGGASDDPNTTAIVEAFKGQLRMIYTKRFGLSEDEVTKIMDGKDGVDGTYFSADDAVARGIITASHVIETPQATKAKFVAELEAAKTSRCAVDYQKVVAKTTETLDPDRIIAMLGAIPKNGEHSIQNKPTQMNNEFQTVASLLGIEAGADALKSISARINNLIKAEADLQKAQADLESAKIELKAKTTAVENLQADLAKVNNELDTFKKAEAAAKEAQIVAVIDEAVKAGKITEDGKADWVTLAKTNLEAVKKSLAAIPARVTITEQIAGDKGNQDGAQAQQQAIDEAEKKAKEAVAKVVGEGFQFNKF